MRTLFAQRPIVMPFNAKALLRLRGTNAAWGLLLAIALLPGLTPMVRAQADTQSFCGERNYETIRLSSSSLQAESLQQLQRQQGPIKLVVDSDRIPARDLEDIADDGIPLLIDLSRTALSARDIRDLARSNNQVQILVNRDRIKAQDLRTLARSGASFVIDVGATSISPKDLRSLQRSLRQTAKDLELVVTSDRISPKDLRSIARGGAKVIFDVGATRISLSDIKSVSRQKGRAALFVTTNRFDEQDINAFIRYGGHIVGSPFCL